MTLSSVILILVNPVLCFLVHFVGLRLNLWKNISGQKSSLLSIFLTLGLSFLVFLWIEPSANLSSSFYFLFVSLLLGQLYFQVFCLSETARRIRILVLIKKGKFSQDSLANTNLHQMVSVRLERLLHLNQVVQEEDKYHSKKTLLTYVAVFFRFYEQILFSNARKI